MNQRVGINHEVQGPRWYNLSQAWINTKGWIAAASRSSQGPLKNDMNNHCCWMHSLLSQQSIVTYCKRRDIIAHGIAPAQTFWCITAWMPKWRMGSVYELITENFYCHITCHRVLLIVIAKEKHQPMWHSDAAAEPVEPLGVSIWVVMLMTPWQVTGLM